MKLQVTVFLVVCFVFALVKPSVNAQTVAPAPPVRLVPPIGHTRHIDDVQASRNGRLLASCGWDNSAILWETSTGRIIRRFPLTAKGRRVRFAENDKSLVTVETQNRIVSWDIESGRMRWALIAPFAIDSVSMRPDGQAVAVAGIAPTAENTATTVIYQAATGKQLQSFGAGSEMSRFGITEILYSPDGAALYGYSGLAFFQYRDTKNAPPSALFAFDAASGKQITAFKSTGAAVAFSKNGKFLLTKGKGSAAWCDARSGATLRTFRQEMKGDKEPQNIALSHDSARFVTVTNGGGVSPDGTIREYSIATGNLLHKTTVSGVGPDNSLLYVPDGRPSSERGVLVTVNEGSHAFCLTDIARDSVVQDFRGGAGSFHTPAVLSPDGRTVFLPNGSHTGIIGWDVTRRTNKHLFFFPSDKRRKDSSPPLSYPVVSGDGRLLVTPGISDEHVFVSDLVAGTVLADIRITINPLSEGIALHPTGEWIAIPVSGADYHDVVKLYSARGVPLRDLRPPPRKTDPLFIRAVGSDATGERVLVSDYDGQLFVFEARTGKLLQTLRWKSKSNREAFSVIVPAGSDKDRVLLTRDSGEISELDLSSGKLVSTSFGDTVEGRVLIATTPDGQMAALGRSDGSIVLWRRTAKTAKTLTGHTGRSVALAFSPDGRRLTSLGGDGMVRFWDTASGTERASLLVFTRQPSTLGKLLLDSSRADREDLMADIPQWIAYNRNGLFEGSETATSQIHFAKGTQTYSADQFFEQYYRSGLLASVMTNANTPGLPAPPKDIVDSLRVGTPPLVRIISPVADGKSAPSATVALKVDATEQGGGGVRAIRLYQNGRLIGGPSVLRGIVVEAVSGATTSKIFTVALSAGANVFRAVAYSKSDLESVPATVTVTYTPPQIVKPNLYVLTVGINTYKDSAMNLSYARPDAEALAAFFEKVGSSPGTLFHKVVVTRLMDTDATGAAIAEKLAALAAGAKPEDVVFLYFAGHGETADNAWYFLPHEMRQMALTERVKEFGIPWATIEAAVGKIAARKIVLVVDACKSGAALSRGLRGADDGAQTMAVMARAQGIHILTASTAQQYAAEVKELGHGILTYALLEGLNGKAASTGGVFVRTLMSYVEDRVPELSRQYRGGEQYPVPFGRGQNFPLVAK